jgi:hypothetical protein
MNLSSKTLSSENNIITLKVPSTFEKTIYHTLDILLGTQTKSNRNVSFYNNKHTLYIKKTKLHNLACSTRNIIQNIYRVFGNFKCYYVHGMGYKCNNAVNTLYLSVGKSQWDSYMMSRGSFCYTTSRKHSWKRLAFKYALQNAHLKQQIENLSSLRKSKTRHKKRKLRTRVKLLRNYHGLIFLYTLSTHQLNKLGWAIQKIRTPNVYTGKGIHYYRDVYKQQKRKLKSFAFKK